MHRLLGSLLWTALLLVQTADGGSANRFVVTFHDGNALEQYNSSGMANLLADAKIEKWYGRRIVLQFDNVSLAQSFWGEAESLKQQFGGSIRTIEEDNLLLASQADHNFNFTDQQSNASSNSAATNVTKVVAILDTGLSSSSIHLYRNLERGGYDFISNEALSLDGDGRDSDWTDPGDANPPDCMQNSWHGTLVANVLAAAPELNGLGYSGKHPDATILPVRVLGACKTGYASDVADAIVWAAGGRIDSLDGMKPNKTADVILMAFAGYASDGCPDFLQSAVDLAVANNVTLVAAAGNSQGQPASHYTPGNCRGVVSVGALDEKGNVASYSSVNAVVNAFGGPMQCLDETGESMQMCTGTSFSVCLAEITGFLYAYNNTQITLYQAGVNENYNASVKGQVSITYNTIIGSVSVTATPFNEIFNFYYIKPSNVAKVTVSYSISANSQVSSFSWKDGSSYDWIYVTGCGLSDTFECIIPGLTNDCVAMIDSNIQAPYTTATCGTKPETYTFSWTSVCKTSFFSTGSYCIGLCSSGSYGKEMSCVKCSPGYYSTGGAVTSCTNCLAGKYSAVQGATSSSTCQTCWAGTYSVAGSSMCLNCSVGSYSSIIGATSSATCQACPAGRYSEVQGANSSATCMQCWAGTYSVAGGSMCLNCSAGTYSSILGANSSAMCQPCKEGILCYLI